MVEEKNTTEKMETENVEPFPTVYVLQAIKNAQQKHGLRHQNYQRYRYVLVVHSLYS